MPGWQKSFDILYKSLVDSGLYNATDEIRLGILNDSGRIIPDERLNDKKFNIVYVGLCTEYERPTILHMRKRSEFETCNYWYLHTKGLRHFGTTREASVLNWVDIMLYWNCTKWRDAVRILNNHDTYGCLLNDYYSSNKHYSGNFWWTTSKHIKNLPETIAKNYVAPENYIVTNKSKSFCAWNHQYSDNYYIDIPEKAYKLEVTKHVIRGSKLIPVNKPVSAMPVPPNYDIRNEGNSRLITTNNNKFRKLLPFLWKR